MGDISEYRGIIVAFTFITVFVFLVAEMKAGSPLMFSDQTSGQSNIPSNINPSDLLLWNSTLNKTVTGTGSSQNFQLNGWNFRVGGILQGIFLHTYDDFLWGLIDTNVDFFDWFNQSNTKVSLLITAGLISTNYIPVTVLDNEFLAGNLSSLRYSLINGKTKINVQISFNQSQYSKPSLAFAGDGLTIIFNQDLSDRNTSINILQFIFGLFTFSLPGVPYYISFVISASIDGALAYLIFIFILRMIGAVFGGGGA